MKQIIIFTATLSLLATATWAQHPHPHPSSVYVVQNNTQTPDYQYHDGKAFLTNGSWLQGRFAFNGASAFTYRASSQAPRQRIRLSMIRRLALAGADTLVTDRRDSTIFVRLGRKLYRQLTGGSTTVVDRRFLVDEDRGKIGRKLYVLDANDNWKKFSSLQKLNRWFYEFQEQSPKKLPDVYRNESEIVKAVAQLNER